MKTKASIRKLRSPHAKNLARIARTLHVLRRQIDTLTELVENEAQQLRIVTRERDELTQRFARHIEAGLRKDNPVPELFPENDGLPTEAEAPEEGEQQP